MFVNKYFIYLGPAEACNFIKKEILTQLFSCEFCKIFKNTFFYRTFPVAASSLSPVFCRDYGRISECIEKKGNTALTSRDR